MRRAPSPRTHPTSGARARGRRRGRIAEDAKTLSGGRQLFPAPRSPPIRARRKWRRRSLNSLGGARVEELRGGARLLLEHLAALRRPQHRQSRARRLLGGARRRTRRENSPTRAPSTKRCCNATTPTGTATSPASDSTC
jgi:hypothetical protein